MLLAAPLRGVAACDSAVVTVRCQRAEEEGPEACANKASTLGQEQVLLASKLLQAAIDMIVALVQAGGFGIIEHPAPHFFVSKAACE